MKHLENLARELADGRHPGAELGYFLLRHSNDPVYLVGVLEMFLEAAERDRDDARKLAARLMAAVKREGGHE